MSLLHFGSACTSFVIVLICPSVLICFVLKKKNCILYTIVIYIVHIKNRGTRAASCSLKNKCFLYCIVPICFNPKEQIKLVDSL